MVGRLLPVMLEIFRLFIKLLIFLAIPFVFSPVDSSLYLCVGEVGVDAGKLKRLKLKLVVCRSFGFVNLNDELRDCDWDCEVGDDGSVEAMIGELFCSRLRDKSGDAKKLSRWSEDRFEVCAIAD